MVKSDVTLEDRFARGWGRFHDYSDVEQMEYKSPGKERATITVSY